jgi:peptide/nickel transport system ATP-binding protein
MIAGTGLVKNFSTGLLSQTHTSAIRGVDIQIQRGETYALVGESGCGKTTLGKLLLLLIQPSEGNIWYKGENITGKRGSDMAMFRRKMQIIPQHPEDALNPRWNLKRSILEPFEIYADIRREKTGNEQLHVLLQQTGLNTDYANRYPHQLSGGELQRAVIARTLALDPEFIVCDEPTSMLDVSVQASIIRLLKEIQQKARVGLLFITHDIRLARFLGDTTGVMHRGQIIEEGPDILKYPLHPYTLMLTSNKKTENILNNVPCETGCHYRPYCYASSEKCEEEPILRNYNGRKIRCHHPERLKKAYEY